MSDSDPRLRWYDILEAITGIRDTIAGYDLDTFKRSWSTQRAVERGIEIISEASRHLPEGAKAQEASIPWRQIAGIGNVLRHTYQRVDPNVIFSIATRQLDNLEAAARRQLARLDAADRTD